MPEGKQDVSPAEFRSYRDALLLGDAIHAWDLARRLGKKRDGHAIVAKARMRIQDLLEDLPFALQQGARDLLADQGFTMENVRRLEIFIHDYLEDARKRSASSAPSSAPEAAPEAVPVPVPKAAPGPEPEAAPEAKLENAPVFTEKRFVEGYRWDSDSEEDGPEARAPMVPRVPASYPRYQTGPANAALYQLMAVYAYRGPAPRVSGTGPVAAPVPSGKEPAPAMGSDSGGPAFAATE